MIITITLREARDDYDLIMHAAERASWPHAVAAANLPFGFVLKEVEHFLDINLR